MRSFFSKLGGNTSKTAEASRSSESDLPTLLAKAADLLKQLRSATEEDFPLLNEATRHGMGRRSQRVLQVFGTSSAFLLTFPSHQEDCKCQ